ncbi:MAG: hypothetical protein ACHQU1_01935 [Gemmatimonadales bacterium]
MVTRQALHLRGYGAPETVATVEVDSLAPGQRLGRAVAGFGLWFVGAIVAVFIPVAHFILVPLCLVAAFVTLIVRAGTSVLVRSASGTCPDCGTAQQLDVSGTWRLPKDVTCRNCHRRLTLYG